MGIDADVHVGTSRNNNYTFIYSLRKRMEAALQRDDVRKAASLIF